MLTRTVLLGLGVALAPRPRPLHAQSAPAGAGAVDTAALQRLLAAEDSRGKGPDGIAPLLSALAGPDTLLRRLAARGLGRLQRPDLGRVLRPLLADTVPAVRAEAANAVAQSLRGIRRDEPGSKSQGMLGTREAAAALSRALERERDQSVADALGRSLGRLPLPDTSAARAAEAAIRERFAVRATAGLAHGLYTLARARRASGNLDSATVVLLRRAAVESADTIMRRLAMLTLAAADALDSATAVRAARDRDGEVRRLTLRAAGTLSPSLRAALVARAVRDSSAIVRTGAAAAARLGENPADCRPLLALARDPNPYVALAAVDSLGSGCADEGGAVALLRRLAAGPERAGPPDHRWQASAHALLALARLDSSAAARLLPAFAADRRPELRVYAARAAAAAHIPSPLFRLAYDRDRNVEEAAIAGLHATVGRAADSVYFATLGSSGHQVVLAASEALDSTAAPGALEALLAAFDRLSATRSENARDPRVSMLSRIGALGSASAAARLEPYLADYDTTVAALAAETIWRWTGRRPKVYPEPLPIRPEPLAAVFLRDGVRLRVRMAPSSGGGSFTVRLFPRDAPATVARVLRLVRVGWYDGKAFQRVEPNFVIQGGGPDANEYVGDAAFMRDELSLRTHARGTLGISSRGRDTGDAQWFINLVDNPLLDHEYTVFGRVESGWEVVDRILEGDRIGRVEVVDRLTGSDGRRGSP